MPRRVVSPVFVGRTEERARLRASFERADADQTRLVLVTGEAGMGKTRLVADTVAWAREAGWTVLEAACLPLGEALPYGPFVEMLGPDLFVSSEATDRLRLFRAVADGLAEHAAAAELAVVIEDLHWADSSTCDLLVFCARVLGGERLRLIGTYRSEEVLPTSSLGRMLAEIGATSWVVRIELAPLERDEIARIAAAIRGEEPPPDLIGRVLARSGGNPFFAEELLATGVAADLLPRTVREAVMARLAPLGAPARSIARVVAVAGLSTRRGASLSGPRVRSELLLASTDVDPGTVDTAVADLVAAGLLLPDGDCMGFRHPLAQEAVLSDLLPGERSSTHRRVAELFTARPELACSSGQTPLAAERAHHWEAAGEPDRALADAVVALRGTDAATAPAEALAQLDRILRLWERVPGAPRITGTDHASLLERAGDAAIAANLFERAAELLRRARAELTDTIAPPHRIAHVLAQLAVARARGAFRIDEAAALIDEAALILPDSPPTRELAFVLARQANIRLIHRDEGVTPLARQAVAVAAAVGQPVDEAVASMVLAWGLVSTPGEDRTEGLRVAQRALELTRDHGDLYTRAVVADTVAAIFRSIGAVEDALSVALDIDGELVALGAPPAARAVAVGGAADALLELGRCDEAERLLTALEPSAGLADWARIRPQIEIAILRGRFDRAHALLTEWAECPTLKHREAAAQAVTVALPLAVAEGRWEDARALALKGVRWQRGWLAPSLTCNELPIRLAAHGLQAEANRREAGHADRGAAAAVERLLAAARHSNTAQLDPDGQPRLPGAACDAALAEADAARALGRDDPHLWRAAVAAADATVRPWPRAYSRMRLACALHAEHGSRAEATDLVHDALRIATTMGAQPLVSEIEAAAARLRIRRADDDPTARPLARFGLTARELQVLDLVAAGLSNREIGQTLYISARTASVHVTNIMRKLEVTSRLQAAAVAHRAQLDAR